MLARLRRVPFAAQVLLALVVGVALGLGQRLRRLEDGIDHGADVALHWRACANEEAARAARAERRLQSALDEISDLRAALARLRRQR